MIISMSFLKIICKMQWIIFRRLEEAIAHREAGKYPISSDILDKTIDELKEILYLIFDYPHKHYTFKHFEI